MVTNVFIERTNHRSKQNNQKIKGMNNRTVDERVEGKL